MLWKDTLLGDVGSEVARTVRLRKEFRSCQRIQRFLTAERTCTHKKGRVQSVVDLEPVGTSEG